MLIFVIVIVSTFVVVIVTIVTPVVVTTAAIIVIATVVIVAIAAVLVVIAAFIGVLLRIEAINIDLPAIIKGYLPNYGGLWGRIVCFLWVLLFGLIYSWDQLARILRRSSSTPIVYW